MLNLVLRLELFVVFKDFSDVPLNDTSQKHKYVASYPNSNHNGIEVAKKFILSFKNARDYLHCAEAKYDKNQSYLTKDTAAGFSFITNFHINREVICKCVH
jgi:hypothetical protein